ncbi:hypothetical protein D0Z66_19730 (plasmid) [Cereibacter sphaeroides]|nr:hypothetical protein D0Z66_19730 [Cereibacter sphaeroides]
MVTYSLNGSLDDWTSEKQLGTAAIDGSTYALYGDLAGDSFVFALSTDGVPIGQGTTLWLDTDIDRSTGYQIWGFTGGTEYNINIGPDGIPRLYSGAAGETLVAELPHATNADRTTLEIAVPRALLAGAPGALRVYADVNDSVFIPSSYDTMNLIVGGAETVGSLTIDGSLADWDSGKRLDSEATGSPGFALYGDVQEDSFVFAITSDGIPIGANTTIWLDTDLSPATGYQIWGFAGGAEYNINFGADGIPRLYTGAAGETLVGTLTHATNAAGTVVEIVVPRSQLAGSPQAVRVLADVNDGIFIPNSYSVSNIVLGKSVGTLTLDGSLADWTEAQRLDTPATGAEGDALYGTEEAGHFVFAISSTAAPIGANTTIWLDTDLNRGTGYQIWGFAGGADYNINIGADGIPRLYTGAAGKSFVADLDFVRSGDGRILEVAVPQGLLGDASAVRVLADVNDSVFIPNDYASSNIIVGQDPVTVGTVTLDGALDDWTGATRLDTPATGAAGYAFHGDLQGESFLFAIASDGTPIGANTTIWLDTDLNTATGYQIWGVVGGADYNINLGADGVARLYSGAAGETLVAELRYGTNAARTAIEIEVPRALIGAPGQVRVLADVNDSTFLPNDYASANLVVGAPPPTAGPNGQMRVAIVYSETTAANFYDLTAYGQLFMAMQNQAMQAGVPFDILSEADLKDAALLGQYGAIVFPGLSHVKLEDLDAITSALQAAKASGVGLIAAGNFLTNAADGSAIAGDSYARMKSLLGVTLDAYGSTEGLVLKAAGGSNPVLEGYAPGEVVGQYGNISYLTFRDVTGTGQTLFEEVVTNGGTSSSHAAVIATGAGGGPRNVHFGTDAIIGNNNILGEVVDWVIQGDGIDVSLQLTRGTSLFHSRNDMDQSQEIWDVVEQDPGIYDAMLPIIEDWYERFGFVGSYYVNIGTEPPDQQTNWAVSLPYYQRILALESEIGVHSTTHPHDTNELLADTPEILALFARVDPRNPGAVDPASLTAAERQLLYSSHIFQFEYSRLLLEQKLGIDIPGAAVPGAPEKLATSREIIRFFDYLSGGYSGVGAGYPGAFGYLTPEDRGGVYLAPNMSFDFSLIGFRDMTPEQATAVWAAEYARIASHATTPIFLFPWHDYGPTNWNIGDPSQVYTLEMFESVIARAAADGAEFVTGADLARRIASFEASDLQVSVSGNTVTATVTSNDAGRFALDFDGKTIASAGNWYAWNGDSLLVVRNGGSFTVTLGTAPADVTRLAELPQRAELVSVSGDGSDLGFTMEGVGTARVVLQAQGGGAVVVTGADSGAVAGQNLSLGFAAVGSHSVTVDYRAGGLVAGTAAAEILLGGALADSLRGARGNDTLSGGGGADDFVFASGGGRDTVLDFASGSDRLVFSQSLGGSAAEILARFQTTADGLLATFTGGERVLLAGLTTGDLQLGDIYVDTLLA